MVLCNGAFDPSYPVEPEPPVTPPPPPPKPEPEPTCIEGSSQIGDAAFDKPALVDIKVKKEELKEARDYGYGFWMRFLTRHPVPLLEGKNQPWYFVSRLARTDPYDNIRIGDRVLAIWLGQAGYTFITMDDKTNNPNIFKAIPYEDIEGVWTYVYFSYSNKLNSAVGFIKEGTKEI